MAEYKLFLNKDAVGADVLGRVETITVDQEVDMPWEARIEFPICLDDNGAWSQQDVDFFDSFGRVRIEARAAGEPFAALIDGPVVGIETRMSFAPNESSVAVVVQDDSILLNREEKARQFEGKLDHEVAKLLFCSVGDVIADTDLEPVPPPPSGRPFVSHRGTQMELLRKLARRQGKHAFVLPGPEPGKSIGVFKQFPSKLSGLPPLVLLGPGRNAQDLEVVLDAQSPAGVSTAVLRLTDKQVLTGASSFAKRRLLGDKPILDPAPGRPSAPERAALKPVRPIGDTVDLDAAAEAEADRLEYAFEASGSIIEGCYPGVLAPYRLVQVLAGGTPLSGNYVITQVSHTLGRSTYTQSFRMLRNASTGTARKGAVDPSRRIA
jgi:hypothetical protein